MERLRFVATPLTFPLKAMFPRFALPAFAALVSCLSAAEPPPTAAGLNGSVNGDTYTAPGGTYSVAIPVLPEFGGQVHDTENVVTFDDNVNLHASIACFPLDLTQKWELETRGARDYLATFYAEFVLKDFQTRFPGTTAEATLFVPELNDGALFGFVLLPGGSAFAIRDTVEGGAPAETPAAKRGNLLFVKAGHLYVLSVELAERVTQHSIFHKTPKEEDEILRERLLKLAGNLRFAPPKTAAAPAPAAHD